MENTNGSAVASVAAAKNIARADNWSGIALAAGCAVYLYANLFADLRTPFLLGGDQAFAWMRAQQLLFGEQIYLDYLEFTPPGADLTYLGFFRLFGPRVWVPNLVVLLLGVGLCWMCWRIARSLMSRAQALLAVALFVVLVYGKLINGTQHWFSLLAVLGAVAVLMKARTPARLVVAGALLGVATFYVQTRGPLASVGIAGCLALERFRKGEFWSGPVRSLAWLFVPMGITWGCLIAYYVVVIGWRTLWFFQVTYVRRYAISGWQADSLGWPTELSWSTLSVAFRPVFACGVVPAVYLVSLWLCWKSMQRSEPSDNTARILLVAAVGAALFIEILPSPSWFRLYCVAAPAVILMPWLVRQAGNLAAPLERILWVSVIALGIAQIAGRHVSQSMVAELPAGRVATTPAAAEKLSWLAAHTHPGQFVLQAGWLSIYLPLAVRNPVFVDYLDSAAWDRLGYLTSSIRELQAKQVQYVLWSPRLDAPTSGLGLFRNFLERHYRRVWTFSDQDQVWERKSDEG
jgi:hypothetical protein